MLGAFYINGPDRVAPGGGCVTQNNGAWTAAGGVLFVDQPAGTGLSRAGPAGPPTSTAAAAAQLHSALLTLFAPGGALEAVGGRPIVVAGESYGGKFVPALAAAALAHEAASTSAGAVACKFGGVAAAADARPPLRVAGAAVGNALVDASRQVLTHADALYYRGALDAAQWGAATRAAWRASALARARAWAPAHAARAALLADLTSAAGLGTLLDVRRDVDYDARGDVPALLNRPDVRAALGVPPNAPSFATCSPAVMAAFDLDIMQPANALYEGLLAAGLPVLLYQGDADAQDGPAAAAAWQATLRWPGAANHSGAPRELWRVGGDGGWEAVVEPTPSPPPSSRVAGYWRAGGGLTHAVVRNGGHMLPHDQPAAALAMLGRWLEESGIVGEGLRPRAAAAAAA
jgi:vitellogenic carboxypeptidase-like protein